MQLAPLSSALSLPWSEGAQWGGMGGQRLDRRRLSCRSRARTASQRLATPGAFETFIANDDRCPALFALSPAPIRCPFCPVDRTVAVARCDAVTGCSRALHCPTCVPVARLQRCPAAINSNRTSMQCTACWRPAPRGRTIAFAGVWSGTGSHAPQLRPGRAAALMQTQQQQQQQRRRTKRRGLCA